MLSLPEDWDYTTRGLASICKEGVDSVCATVRELEAARYIIRRRVRDKTARCAVWNIPCWRNHSPAAGARTGRAFVRQTRTGQTKTGKTCTANPAQLNTKEQKKEITKKRI